MKFVPHTACVLHDGRRLHLQHGPIDLVVEAFGSETEVRVAYEAADATMDGLLAGLVAELPLLRSAVTRPTGESSWDACAALTRDSLPHKAPPGDAAQAAPTRTATRSVAANSVATGSAAGLSQGAVETAPWSRTENHRPVSAGGAADHSTPIGPVAMRMWRAVAPHAQSFVTPMAAVAGAVADEVLAAMCAHAHLDRAYVNNGGDISLHLAPGHGFDAGLVADERSGQLLGRARIESGDGIGGIATSGWRGRSASLGIADAVTALAANAAAADVAATLLANAVDVEHSAIRREPARELDEGSDLGDRLVTTAVGPLDADARQRALDRGAACANAMHAAGLVHAVVLALQGETRTVGPGYGAHSDAGRRASEAGPPPAAGVVSVTAGHASGAGSWRGFATAHRA